MTFNGNIELELYTFSFQIPDQLGIQNMDDLDIDMQVIPATF